MDLRRLRTGDWAMAAGGLAALVVLFLDWYEVEGIGQASAWEALSVVDVILALAALMALTAFALTALQPTAAVPLALASLTSLVALIGLVLVALRLLSPPELVEGYDTGRLLGAWLGLGAAALLAGGCLASIRDERLPRPDHPVEPRLVEP